MGGVIKRVQIFTNVSLYCCSCSVQQDMAFHKDGEDAMKQFSFFDGAFLTDYAKTVYNWTILPDGRAWCPHHSGDQK